MADKKILLIEPGYKNKYPPLGLMKLAQYHGPRGKRDQVKFIKGESDKTVHDVVWDRIYVTTLFSFEWKTISRTIDYAIQLSHGQPSRVFVGGIAASLMHDAFLSESRWGGVRFIKGLLSTAPAISLQLDDFAEELYSEDRTGLPIEDLVPDYSILDQIKEQYVYPVQDAYFVYASRGCVRKCHFCGVPKLEGDQRDTPSITKIVKGIEKLYGAKKDLTLMDNNVVASPNYTEIISEIRDLGFETGAMLRRGRVPVQRRVDFNQGVDARILCKGPMYLREMSTICIKPLRIAFDHIGLRKPYEASIRYAHEFGLHELSNYMLYNFHDTPTDLYRRMRLNLDLNEELDVRIFSFPMRYQPTDLKDRSFVGENWNRYFLRSMQIILQATHGVVSGSPTFFKRAFGDTEDEFSGLLMRPHHFLFNRTWYEDFGGRAEFDEYLKEFARLGDSEKHDLLEVLSQNQPSKYSEAAKGIKNDRLKSLIQGFYAPLPEGVEEEIWRKSKARQEKASFVIPEDEKVEDAGLEEMV